MLHLDFVQGSLLQSDLTADVYVNAASVNPLPIEGWGGIAGVIRNQIQRFNQNNILRDDWARKGMQVAVGTADFVRDNNLPALLNWAPSKKAYLIHAGAPDSGSEATRKLHLKNAYLAVLTRTFEFIQTQEPSSGKQWSVAIPPLGIGIYGNSPVLSAESAFNAIQEFSQQHPNAPLKCIFAIYDPSVNSNDFIFYSTLNNLYQKKILNPKQPEQPRQENALSKIFIQAVMFGLGLFVIGGLIFPSLSSIYLGALFLVSTLGSFAFQRNQIHSANQMLRERIDHSSLFANNSWDRVAYDYGRDPTWTSYFKSWADPRSYRAAFKLGQYDQQQSQINKKLR